MSDKINNTTNWADDDDELDEQGLPETQVIANDDGTKTIIEYRMNDDGKKVK
ncbi:translation initiation factor eIF3 subunit g, partial [Coemansia sp. RSA 2703]